MDTNILRSEKLYIIGNGFDLHHGMQCGYNHFKEWLYKNYNDVYNNLQRIYGTRNTEWWNTFEESLANFNTNYYPRIVAQTPFFKLQNELIKLYGEEGKAFLDECELNDESIAGNRNLLAPKIASFELVHLKKDLNEAFGDWVKSLKVPSMRNPDVSIDTNAWFFTFNYTRTLEDLYDVDEKNVLHLHGSVDNNTFVIGHNLTAHEMNLRDLRTHMYSRDPDNDNGEDEARIEMFDVIELEMKKPVKEIIWENRAYFNALDTIEEMEVLGFSYSAIDLPYLERIFEIAGKNISVKFGWHTNEDYINAQNFAKKMALSNYITFCF